MGAKSLHPQDMTKLSEATNRPWLVHLFRTDGEIHAVTSVRTHVKRDGIHRALCGKVISPLAQRISPGHSISCTICLKDTTALGTLYG